MKYEYITEDNLENKQTYFYSKFSGKEFLDSYTLSREATIEKIPGENESIEVYKCSVGEELMEVLKQLKRGNIEKLQWDNLEKYIKRFEVRKRIYTEYLESGKPSNDEYKEMSLYLLLADCLSKSANIFSDVKHFNCLLKIDDTLISVIDMLKENEKQYLKAILRAEILVYQKLYDRSMRWYDDNR